ncbi:MAG TPA: glycosyltransferase family 4 protein [Hanamia sp.]|nr:glycosyltransferase family 4 protein [Hanamia sp.]
MKKIAIITTHPIQYNAPFFKLLAESRMVKPKVFYTWGETVLRDKYDPEFGKTIDWNIPLLEGYEYEFVENAAARRGSDHFRGIDNPGIIDKIKEWQPDALLVYGWNFRSHLKFMRYFKKRMPVWFRGDSTLLDQRGLLRNVFRRIVLRWVYKHVDLVFYTGLNNKKYYLEYGVSEEKLVYAPHAVDNYRFGIVNEKVVEEACKLRQTLQIPPNGIVYLFAGKLSPKKGVSTLIRAFKKSGIKDHFLVIAGSGPLEAELKRECEGDENIKFAGFQNQAQMPGVYAACDVFVLPSVGPGETWGLSVNEAMAAGKPVIVSNKCGSAIDLVEEGRNGFIFEAGNSFDLADKMKRISCNRENLEQFGRESKMKIRDFTFEKFVNAIENSIKALG